MGREKWSTKHPVEQLPLSRASSTVHARTDEPTQVVGRVRVPAPRTGIVEVARSPCIPAPGGRAMTKPLRKHRVLWAVVRL